MNTDKLAPVFLDNQPISLKDPRPKVSAILSASGKPETTDVKWLQFQPNTQGKSLRSEEVLDRTTDPSKPIYLTSAGAAHKSSAQPAAKTEFGAETGTDDESEDDSEGMQSADDAEQSGEKRAGKSDDE